MNRIFLENTFFAWVSAFGLLFIAILLIKLFSYIIKKKVKTWASKTTTTWDNFLIEIIESEGIPVLYTSCTYLVLENITFPPKVEKLIYMGFLVVISFFILRTITLALKKVVLQYISKQENSQEKEKQARGLIIIVNIIVWLLGIVFVIDNLGYDVTTLVAGLGIGGIAIALAAQAILSDLFSYFVIYFDKPFEIGDFVVVDDKCGTIEHIGIKTTRIRTLTGDQLVCSNNDLTNARLHNYKKLEERRILFTIGVTYQTTQSQLKEIPELVRNVIDSVEMVDFKRAHFVKFGDFSLNFEFVYNVLTADYDIYLDKQHEIYLKVFEAFQVNGIEFAYPTQTLFLQQEKMLLEKH